MFSSDAESGAYHFAKREGLHDPAGFSITHAEDYDDKEALAEAARRWEDKHLRERRARLEEELEELKSRIRIADNDLERNKTAGYGT